MVYEVKCNNCGEIIDWGGTKPENKLGPTEKPDDVIEFDGNKYCKDCVQKFVRFGIGEMGERVTYLEDRMEEALDALGISKAQGAD